MTLVTTQIAELITQVGFPIAFCIMFFTFTNKTLKQNTEALIELKTVIREKLR